MDERLDEPRALHWREYPGRFPTNILVPTGYTSVTCRVQTPRPAQHRQLCLQLHTSPLGTRQDDDEQLADQNEFVQVVWWVAMLPLLTLVGPQFLFPALLRRLVPLGIHIHSSAQDSDDKVM